MSKTLMNADLRSEEVQEILGATPRWMIRYGSTIIFSLILLIIIISWLVKYPDVVSGTVIITTQTPPQKEFSKISGKLDSIYVNDSQYVARNTVLAVLENTANAEDVYYLKSILDTISIKNKVLYFPLDEIPILILGEIESNYASFETSYSEYELNKKLKPFSNEAIANQMSLNEVRVRLQSLQTQFILSNKQLEMKKNELTRNKNLLDKGVISNQDYEVKQMELLNVERNLKSLGIIISETRESIGIALKTSKNTEIDHTRQEKKLLRNVLQAFNQLTKSIRDWENKYVLKSEIDGKVSFLNYWDKNQTVNQNDLVFAVIPMNYDNYIGKIKASMSNSGKIEIGQNVNIRLENYPEAEFGILQGTVNSISLVPDEDGFYSVSVSLSNNLLTSYNKTIEFKYEMRGTAEIITKDIRLLERFTYQLRKLISKES